MKIVILYKKGSDGIVRTLEVNADSYPDRDSFNEALDFYYDSGYHDTYSEASTS